MKLAFNPITVLHWSAYFPERADALAALDASAIPIAVRRRCSQASKIALSLAMQTMKNSLANYAVFASQHGEIGHTVSLLTELQQQQPLSPIRFSQSVHNTASGLWTMLQGSTMAVTSIAAGTQTFAAAMLEALTWLKLNPGSTVLVVAFDEKLPAPYQILTGEANNEYGLALLLTCQTAPGIKIRATLSMQDDNHCNDTYSANAFLQWLTQVNQQSFSQSINQQQLCWQHHHDQ